MRAVTFILAILLALVVTGCEEAKRPPLSELRANAPVMKIVVLADGMVLADGDETAVDALDVRFAELAEAYGVVWYYRENPDDEPNEAAAGVTRKLVDHLLPIALSREPDFADITGQAGPSVPARDEGSAEPAG